LDDDKTQHALMFLLELAHLPESKDDSALQAALTFGLDALLAAQAPNGGWPQGFSAPTDPALPIKKPELPQEWDRKWPEANDYTPYYTLNDGNLLSVAKLLIRANELSPDAKWMRALKKLGDVLILAQCPAPQTGWAQQYDHAMKPAWARKFEPPAVSSIETLSALLTLQEIWLATGDEKYLSPRKSALEWLEKSRLPDGQYARFYELHTNKPLYFVKDTYEVTYEDSNLPTHYGFKIEDLQEDIEDFQERSTMSREEQLEERQPPSLPKSWLSKAKGANKKVVTALSGQNKEGVWTDDNQYEAALFIKHVQAMTTYYQAAKAAGPLFDELRAKENAKEAKPDK
jgi:hypothetical protein